MRQQGHKLKNLIMRTLACRSYQHATKAVMGLTRTDCRTPRGPTSGHSARDGHFYESASTLKLRLKISL